MYLLRCQDFTQTLSMMVFFRGFYGEGFPNWTENPSQAKRFSEPDLDLLNQLKGFYTHEVWVVCQYDWIWVDEKDEGFV